MRYDGEAIPKFEKDQHIALAYFSILRNLAVRKS